MSVENAKDGAAYDKVGAYNQNQINGFKDDLITIFLDQLNLTGKEHVLDAMGGDGNLTHSLIKYCQQRDICIPKITVLEYSRVQAEFAKKSLAEFDVDIIWGDIVNFTDRATGKPLPQNKFDRVMIKSANHEIPLARQQDLYKSVFKMLRTSGIFVNMGFAFDCPLQRDEMRKIARVKDTLAGMLEAVQNRHFLTKDELEENLKVGGFNRVSTAHKFNYSIRSSIVSAQYFKTHELGQYECDLEHQMQQLRSPNLRRAERIKFEGDDSIMILPGEISVAVKQQKETSIYEKYPYELLRVMDVHKDLLETTQSFIQPNSKVLDIGCGPGFLGERLQGIASEYYGVDHSSHFIESCKDRFRDKNNFYFVCGDAAKKYVDKESMDAVALLNVLYHYSLQPVQVLKSAVEALRVKGRIIVSGPLSEQSFILAFPKIQQQLTDVGVLPDAANVLDEVKLSNQKLLSKNSHYWSAEGMVALLKMVGISTIIEARSDFYYGNSYFVVGEK